MSVLVSSENSRNKSVCSSKKNGFSIVIRETVAKFAHHYRLYQLINSVFYE